MLQRSTSVTGAANLLALQSQTGMAAAGPFRRWRCARSTVAPSRAAPFHGMVRNEFGQAPNDGRLPAR